MSLLISNTLFIHKFQHLGRGAIRSAWNKHIQFLVFKQKVIKTGNIAVFGKKDLTFTILDIVLEIVCNRFGGAEILHGFRNLQAHLFTQGKEMIDSVFASKDYSLMVEDLDFRLTEFYRRHALYLEELIEVHVDAILMLQFSIRRFFKISGSILGDKYVLNLHFQPISFLA